MMNGMFSRANTDSTFANYMYNMMNNYPQMWGWMQNMMNGNGMTGHGMMMGRSQN
jgi:hypothetical protein